VYEDIEEIVLNMYEDWCDVENMLNTYEDWCDVYKDIEYVRGLV